MGQMVNIFTELLIGEHGYLFSGNARGTTVCLAITDPPASPSAVRRAGPEQEQWRAGAPGGPWTRPILQDTSLYSEA